VRDQEIGRRYIEIMVEQEGSDRADELLTGFRHHVARGTPPGRRGVSCLGAGFSVAEPQPTKEPPYRLVR